MATVKVTKDNFKATVLDSKVPVLLDFWAPWCGPCRMVAPIMEDLSEDVSGKAVVGKINVDEELELAQQYGIMSIPTIMVFANGTQKNKMVGFRDKSDLRNLLGV
ncbi:MAG: thioredoxin [Saccharofermentanales bacterium]